MSKIDICIGLCVKNNEFGLPFVFKNLNIMRELLNIELIVAYDDSSDNSLKLLEESDFHPILLNVKNTSSIRTERISNARNTILEYISSLDKKPEYFAMMDTNEYSCIGPIQIDVLKEAFQRYEEWDCISFNREAGYYDTWALSFEPYIFSFFHFMNWRSFVDIMRKDFNDTLQSPGDDLLEVWSSFNGFAIYKTDKFINCRYSHIPCIDLIPRDLLIKQINLVGTFPMMIQMGDCEHRKFHFEAIQKNGARIRVMKKYLFLKCKELPENITLRGPA
jgi:hypothetical protein